jgi:hypothetical protein
MQDEEDGKGEKIRQSKPKQSCIDPHAVLLMDLASIIFRLKSGSHSGIFNLRDTAVKYRETRCFGC